MMMYWDFATSIHERAPMWFNPGDLVLLAAAEFLVPVLNDPDGRLLSLCAHLLG